MPNKKTLQEYFDRFKIDEAWIRDAYEVRQLSLPDIHHIAGISPRITLIILKELGIKTRTIQESNALKNKLEKYKKTCLSKYGFENVSNVEKFKEKKRETSIKNYGVDNIWKSEGYGEYVNDLMLEKHGVKRLTGKESKWKNLTDDRKAEIIERMMAGGQRWRDGLSEEEKTEISERLKNASGSVSKLEGRVSQALTSMSLPFEAQFTVGRFRYDFYFKKLKLILEVNGDFWHANPYKYSYDQIINFPYGEKTAQEIWDKDKIKKDLAESHGLQVYSLWESDLNNMTNDCIVGYIQKMILERIFDLEVRNLLP